MLQMDLVRLQPVSRTVAVEMVPSQGLSEALVQSGFHLGKFQRSPSGRIEALRLIPTRQGFRVPEAANSFAVGGFSVCDKNSHCVLEFVAAANQTMTVQLIALFELSQVELSPTFEIGALVARSRSTEVFIRNSGTGEGTAFQLEQVELDAEGELKRLLVRRTA